MNMMNKLKSALLVFICGVFISGATFAADIQVITSGAFADALKALVPEYEKQLINMALAGQLKGLTNILNGEDASEDDGLTAFTEAMA